MENQTTEYSSGNMETFSYDNKIVWAFALATIAFGAIAFVVGLYIAAELFVPGMNLGIAQLTFGRLRPIHTNAAIFAFVGNAIFMGVYHSVPRLCKASMWSKPLGWIHFWGWQIIILSAVATIPFGYTTGKEYAELEWPIDIAIAVIWVIFGINMMMTLINRREKHLYVAIWFFISTWVTVAILHIVNSIAVPAEFLKSYPVYAGVQDALVQWWYGHNAVAFFLTTPFLGLMYYYLPKAANRPIYSYRLSIIHFWSLIFIYIWAGPHHLIYTSLPDWAQSLGTVFSLMLIAPSWGGMLNGLLTLRGAWHLLREEPVLKFLVVAVTAYGMSTLEGPLLAVKSVNAISHYTDWTIAHVHVGTLGWNGFMAFGVLYWLVPKLFKTNLFSKSMANAHFWIGFVGIVMYVVPLWWAAIAQSLMWKEFNEMGMMMYPNFLETVTQILPMYALRVIGGSLYLIGAVLMIINLFVTVSKGKLEKEEMAQAMALPKHNESGKFRPHRWIEGKPIPFLIAATVAILVGSMVELIPMFAIKSNIPTITEVKPYTPLELLGRDIYVAEGCYLCHSQMVRPFRDETERYGEYSKAGEFVYDRPFQWGSKRTGPDLHRVGLKYPNAWHFLHMEEPESMSPGSIMPVYPWLLEENINNMDIIARLRALKSIGDPYTDDYIDNMAQKDLKTQAQMIVDDLKTSNINVQWDKKIVALTAYLQRIGTDIRGSAASTSLKQ